MNDASFLYGKLILKGIGIMFKAFSKGFNELFGVFVAVLGAIGGFVAFLYLLVETVQFLETMIGTVWAIILMCAFIVLAACVGHGLCRMNKYKKAKKSYELNKQKREEILDKFEAETGHRDIHMFNYKTWQYKGEYDNYTIKMREAEEEMHYWEGK